VASDPIRPDYESQAVRITDHAVTDDVIQGKTFSNCSIVGPAILAPIESVSFVGCNFDVADNDPASILIVVPPRWLVGAIALRHCGFYNCRFSRIGLICDESFGQYFLSMTSGGGST